jgi:hypothetical protein
MIKHVVLVHVHATPVLVVFLFLHKNIFARQMAGMGQHLLINS